jgi:ATPase subunit of ABC transporter with duplicated ATPase domains
MKRENLEKTVEEFFAEAFDKKMYDLPKRIKDVLEIVHLNAPLEKQIKQFSGGQQARLLLAYALIQQPDISRHLLRSLSLVHLIFLQNLNKTFLSVFSFLGY